MYKFNKSIAVKDGNWVSDDLQNATLESILQDYTEARVAVTRADAETPIELRTPALFEAFRKESNKLQTLNDFIEQMLDNEVDYHKDVTYLSEADCVVVRKLTDYPVTIKRHNHKYHPTTVLPEGEDVDLLIENDLAVVNPDSPTQMFENCLFYINGYVYPTELVNGRLYILRAAAAINPRIGCSMNVIDFSAVGGVDIIPIKKEMITVGSRSLMAADGGQVYVSNVGIEIDTEVVDRPFMFCLGGFIDLESANLSKLGQKHFKLEMNNNAYVKRLLGRPAAESSLYFEGQASMSTASYFNFNPERFLTQDDSYIIVFKDPGIKFLKQQMQGKALPGAYEFHRKPAGIVRLSSGKLANYQIDDAVEGRVKIQTQPNVDVSFEEVMDEEGVVTIMRTSVNPDKKAADISDATLIDIYRV